MTNAQVVFIVGSMWYLFARHEVDKLIGLSMCMGGAAGMSLLPILKEVFI